MFTTLREKDPFLAQLNSLSTSSQLDLPPGPHHSRFLQLTLATYCVGTPPISLHSRLPVSEASCPRPPPPLLLLLLLLLLLHGDVAQ